MRSTEPELRQVGSHLGPKMRAAFEATQPSDRAILERYDVARLPRTPTRVQRKGVGVGTAVASFLAAAGVLLIWKLAANRPVAIEGSLERDLQARRGGVLESTPEPQNEHDARKDAERVVAPPLPLRQEAARLDGEDAASEENVSVDRTAPVSERVELEPREGVEAAGDAGWANVTEAMRRRDWAAAQEALAPLLASSDGETRDGARLVKIRLELGSAPGGKPPAHLLAELDELARSGATSSIRASARRLHKSLVEGETKHPLVDGELPKQEGK